MQRAKISTTKATLIIRHAVGLLEQHARFFEVRGLIDLTEKSRATAKQLRELLGQEKSDEPQAVR